MVRQASISSGHQDESSSWWHVYLRHRYGVLFYSLLVTLVGTPILRALGLSGIGLQAFVGLNLLAAALPLEGRKVRWLLPAILVGAIALGIVSRHVGHVGLSTASLILWTGIALYAVFVTLRLVLRSPAITLEHLYAALSTYLLVGVFLGLLYWTLEEAWPASIVVIGQAPHQFSLAEGIYFSFITLATVGYGDMVPGTDIVRGLAIVEAIAGQFYLAVMIARLMSLYMREAR
jgi:Ion channel